MDIKTYEIIQRIKLRRKELKLSYQELAERTGLSKSTLQRYETGDIANIPLSKIETLAKGLETTPQYIMGWVESPSHKSASAARLENSELTPDEDKQISDFIDFMLRNRRDKD